MNTKNDQYAPQKKYLAQKRKRLSVWVETEKYEAFKSLVQSQNQSIYGLINAYIDEYMQKSTKN